MSIAQKFLLTILFVALFPLMSLGLLNLITADRAIYEQIQGRIDNTARHHLDRITTANRNADIQLNNVKHKAQIRLLLDQYNSAPSEPLRADLNRSLKDIRQQNEGFHRLHIVDLKGTVIASTDNTQIGKSYRSTEVFKRALIASTISIFFKNPEGEVDQYLATPLELNLRKLGVVIVEATTAPYTLVVKDYSELGKTGESYLVRDISATRRQYLSPLRFKPDASLTTASTAVDYRGQETVNVVNTVASTDWKLITKIDTAEVNGPLIAMRQLWVVTLLVTTAMASLLGWYLSRLIMKPIKDLTQVVLRLAKGDLSQRAKVRSTDEIGTLATTFNDMASRLQELYQGLNEKIAERTKELDNKVRQLKESNTTDEAILGSIGDGMVVTGRDGKILLINSIAAEFLDIDQAEALKGSIAKIAMYDDTGKPIPPSERPTQVVLKTGKKVQRIMSSMQKKGGKRALGVTATPVIRKDKIIGVIQTMRDITKEREIDRMKTEFISLASHQLRTPLSAIKWFSEMLVAGDAGKLKAEQQEFAQNIADSTERMIELVSSLLNISRIESGRIMIEPEPTDLRELVNGIVNDLKAKTEEKRQTLIISVHADLPKIKLDPRLVGQVYLNLLTNAIKYTPKGGEISVFISKKGKDVISQVTDNGYGIPKDQQKRIFQKFFRAENVAKHVTDGTGLGLYLIKAIVESSGGKIWFESEENKGTTFWFSLPLSGMKPKEGEVTLDK